MLIHAFFVSILAVKRAELSLFVAEMEAVTAGWIVKLATFTARFIEWIARTANPSHLLTGC